MLLSNMSIVITMPSLFNVLVRIPLSPRASPSMLSFIWMLSIQEPDRFGSKTNGTTKMAHYGL